MQTQLGVDISGEGMRLDAWVAAHHPDLSRTRAQELIRSGGILLNGGPVKPNHPVHARDRVMVDLPDSPAPTTMQAEDIPLDTLFEDEDLLVILKPAGMVVHPSPGHETGTLVNALLHRCRDLAGIGGELRPGIVHRLDKGTTGLLVVAKNDKALRSLQSQFKNRRVSKTYLALVWGRPKTGEVRVKTTIGRDPRDRKRMCVNSPTGRNAESVVRLSEAFARHSLVEVDILTGRTHQIRVHLSHLKTPIVGDPVYGRKREPELPFAPGRQMLHAWTLSFHHPRTKQIIRLVAPLPDDMNRMIDAFRAEPMPAP